ncbi:hypothetical protein JAAARDRAFT_61372 [Jaapia argillacea MUCL 33604]|uniref:Deacetylase sirtuin-type domain-containing protein n=1 Tax=Jaapia argillacea MUCL 33604 TaxID=933084 RepID=A0A067PHL1_9AGAM|nr:hypothetical protein JAAARDRAFT_61372 [Jaapia argillacea MUCL 33604]
MRDLISTIMTSQIDKESFRKVLASSKNIIVLSGAGLSVASGIPTYRGPTAGVWTKDGDALYSTAQTFKDDPSGLWQFYHLRRQLCLNAQPNDAHRALSTLLIPSTLSRIAPSASSPPLHITQNIDSLSIRVLDDLHSDLKPTTVEEYVKEMHGSIFVTRCTSCQHVQRTYAPSLSSTLSELAVDGERYDIPHEKLPRCGGDAWGGSNRFGNCGGLLRPEVVWFGEVPPLMGEIARKMNWCDLLLVVGTSFTVQPAAGFASQVKARGGKVAVFNLERTKGDEVADYMFLGPCEQTLPEILDVQSDIARLWS